ncbi:MAG: hypothetical protein WEE67_04290 [Chloroflexota bacterium]
MKWTRISLLTLLGGTILVSCQTIPGTTTLFVPRYEPLTERPTALLSGTLTIRDGCVWIVTEFDRFLALWPSNYHVVAEDGSVAVSGDGVQVSAGDDVTAGGGEYPPEQTPFVESLIGVSVPTDCRDRYWLVTQLQPFVPL